MSEPEKEIANPEMTIVDLWAKKTDRDWFKVWDQFWTKATPKLFEWFGWVLTLSAMYYVARTTESRIVWGMCVVGFISIMNYYHSLFARIQIKGLPFATTPRKQFWISGLLTGIVAVATVQVVWSTVTVLVESQISKEKEEKNDGKNH